MKLFKITTIATLLTGSYCYANNWLQAELTFNQAIDHKQYLAKVTLIRPESYFIENHANKRGEKLTVNFPEMGLDNVTMDIVSFKTFKGIPIIENGDSSYKQPDEVNWTDKTNRPVTATFKRYAKEVHTYKFRNLTTNETSIINATPNHSFYVTNKHTYIPIAEVTADDELLSQAGEAVKLECANNQQYNCGTQYNKDPTQPTLVYNFEVYQQHRYFVGDKSDKYGQGILVHNPCKDPVTYNDIEKPYYTLVTPIISKHCPVCDEGHPTKYNKSTIANLARNRSKDPMTNQAIIEVVKHNGTRIPFDTTSSEFKKEFALSYENNVVTFNDFVREPFVFDISDTDILKNAELIGAYPGRLTKELLDQVISPVLLFEDSSNFHYIYKDISLTNRNGKPALVITTNGFIKYSP